MKAIFACLTLALAFSMTTVPADAKGCIKGAIVGGIAGHYAARHGLLGAAAGCVIGHHAAKQHEKEMQSPSPDQSH
jgi:outer membrane lipoprotein SlyB